MQNSILNVVFLGTPDFAIPSLEILSKTPWVKVLAIITQTDKEANRGQKIKEPPVKTFGKEHGILVLQTEKISKDEEIIKKIIELNPDVLITAAFGQILNQKVLDIALTLNVHASLLPKYRGAAPINYAILNGEHETGVSIMKTELGLDSGPVLLQKKCIITENETSFELTKKLSIVGSEALLEALELVKNKKTVFTEQNHEHATKSPSLKKELGLIDWTKTKEEIHNQIRGLQPWPGAYTKFREKILKVWESRIDHEDLKINDSVPNGQIVEVKDFLKIKTKNGFLKIYKIQEENKKILNVKDWVNGARVKAGENLV